MMKYQKHNHDEADDIAWIYTHVSGGKNNKIIQKALSDEHEFRLNDISQTGDEPVKLDFDTFSLWTTASQTHSILRVLPQLFKQRAANTPTGFSGADNQLIVDIGANEGFYLLAMKLENAAVEIIAVEPNPYALKLLRLNISENRLKNVHIVETAVSLVQGETKFEIIKQVTAVGGIKINRNKKWLKENMIDTISVKSITLDQLYHSYVGDKTVSLLKIDTEGSELDILKSGEMALSETLKVELEYHSQRSKQDCLELLLLRGFRLVGSYEQRNSENGVLFMRKE